MWLAEKLPLAVDGLDAVPPLLSFSALGREEKAFQTPSKGVIEAQASAAPGKGANIGKSQNMSI